MIAYRDIVDFPGYRFGEDGSAWSLWVRGSKRHRLGAEWKRLKVRPNSRTGYLYVTIRDSSRAKRDMRLNVLVLWAFTGDRPDGFDATHKDGDRKNNTVGNLAWKTHAENIADKFDHGTVKRGREIAGAILDEDSVAVIKTLIGVSSYAELGRTFGVSEATIRSIAHGRTWKHVG